jgi:hypothetical protein
VKNEKQDRKKLCNDTTVSTITVYLIGREMKKIVFIMLMVFCGTAAEGGLLSWWKFDEGGASEVVDSTGKIEDRISGNFKYVEGVSGKAVRFDGFTTKAVRSANKVPKLGDSFTIEAWVALGAYPWNICPIVAQEKGRQKGYYFGVDSQGHVGLGLCVGGKWIECVSGDLPGVKVGLELRKWYYIAGVYNSQKGLSVYINGQKAVSNEVTGEVTFAPTEKLLIGKNNRKIAPSHPVRNWATFPSWYSFDGIIDEIKIHNAALGAEYFVGTYKANLPTKKPDIGERKFPSVKRPGRFGAYYTKLKYYEQWDALWRTGDYSDVVVKFDEYPINVMFWRGSRYSPCWVTENGKWMADQSREVGSNWDLREGPASSMPTGCCEHMSDAQCRFSHVRIIENIDSRVVIHWRYALIDVKYRQADVDPNTGWGYWGDEVYTIYPDGVAVRHVSPGRGSWQETIFFNEPGTKPEDNCELEAITLVNLKGQTKSYSWENGYPKFDLSKPIIQMTNLKSKYRPFIIYRRRAGMEVFNVEVRPEYSHFPWWNHWPVAQVASDGRHAQASDRASHSSLVWGDTIGRAVLYGMTDKPAVSLVKLAKSWNMPSKLTTTGDIYESKGYDYKQRAYIIESKKQNGILKIELKASENSPVVNPAFVIKDWGQSDAQLKLNGKSIKRGKDFRFGHRHRIMSTDLVIWLKTESVKPVEIEISYKM